MLQVVAAGDQFLLQIGQQLGIARRVVLPDVVRLVDDAASQQPGPDAVHDAAREPRILRGDQPIGEDLPRIPVRGQLDLGSIRKDRRQRLAVGRRRRGSPALRRASPAGCPDARMAARPGAVLPGTALDSSGSQKTFSSFHSLVGL